MRQAGRWDPEFNRLRAGKAFYDFSEDVELAAAASLLPRRFGVDAIILFYDITTLTVAMGLPFTLEAGRGPVRAVQRRSAGARPFLCSSNRWCRSTVASSTPRRDTDGGRAGSRGGS